MRVAILIPPDAHGLEIAGLGEVFDEANRAVPPPAPYELQRLAGTGAPLRCSDGLTILPDHDLRSADPAPDTLIVAAAYGVPEPLPSATLSWLRATAPRTRRFGSVCTGAFILAEAGLLQGRRITTHWAYVTELAHRVPDAHVEPDRLFIRDGNLFTSAGVTAATDLALDLVEEDLGRDVALAVARRLVMFLKRPGGQTQYSIHLAAQTAHSTPLRRVQDLVRDHVGDSLSLPSLAHAAGISQRALSRLFRQELGMSVGDYLIAARLDVARRLLEQSDLPVKTVAAVSGFGSSDAMRRAFIRRIGTTPGEYRSRFGTTRRAP